MSVRAQTAPICSKKPQSRAAWSSPTGVVVCFQAHFERSTVKIFGAQAQTDPKKSLYRLSSTTQAGTIDGLSAALNRGNSDIWCRGRGSSPLRWQSRDTVCPSAASPNPFQPMSTISRHNQYHNMHCRKEPMRVDELVFGDIRDLASTVCEAKSDASEILDLGAADPVAEKRDCVGVGHVCHEHTYTPRKSHPDYSN